MWPFSKKIVGKQPRKVALINVADYGKDKYTAYWEIRVTGSDKLGYEHITKVFAYTGGTLLAEKAGATKTRDKADTAAQKWVLSTMKKYKRAV